MNDVAARELPDGTYLVGAAAHEVGRSKPPPVQIRPVLPVPTPPAPEERVVVLYVYTVGDRLAAEVTVTPRDLESTREKIKAEGVWVRGGSIRFLVVEPDAIEDIRITTKGEKP